MTASVLTRVRSALGDVSIRVQIILLLLLSQIVAHAIMFVVVSGVLVRNEEKDQLRIDISEVFITVLATIDPEDSATDHPTIISVAAFDERFEILPTLPDQAVAREHVTALIRAEVPAIWQGRVFAFDRKNEHWRGPRIPPFALAAALGDGSYLFFYPSPDVVARTFPILAATLALLLGGVPLALSSIWAGTFLVAPVARLSSGVRSFGVDAQAKELDEDGPREVRGAIIAFNQMQRKLRRLIDERAQTLAAIGHDMRTPLTRLRLRLEDVDLGDAAAGTQRDIVALETMIDDALDFLRSESKHVDLSPVNLTSLCETVVSDFADNGDPVDMADGTQIDVICDITLTRRSLNNVIGNAVKYAGGASVTIGKNLEKNTIVIAVSDTGPGIPETLMEIVQKPFNRLSLISSGQEDAPKGFGLGLAIAHECMERQGGALTLAGNSPTGLVATLHLPMERPE